MTMRTTWLGTALVLLPVALVAQSGNDIGVNVVKRASQAYMALSSFQAEFHQQFDDKVNLGLQPSRGMLYQEGRNHFAMRFTDPEHDFIVADGTKLCVYTPSETPRQAIRYPQQSSPTYGSNLLGTFLDNATDRYRISYQGTETIDGHMTDKVLMEPIANDMPFRRATIWFDRESSLPRRLEIEETRSHKRILQFSQIQTNRLLPAKLFTCNTPLGTRIIDQ